ncbi:MAG: hypothetical protein J1F40_07685 [Prevotellaceae bacterium]|nr:hypothetical protein [Prevotellaceae bacterium]
MKKKLLQCMTVLTALLFASCSSELALEGFSPDNAVTGEEVEVTFSISAEGAQMQTRVGGPGRYQTKVGRGTEIDMLIYAVYEKDEKTGKYTLLKQYGKRIVVDENHKGFADDNVAIAAKNKQEEQLKGKDENGEDVYDTYDGQTIINLEDKFKKDENAVEEITLRLMRNKEYHIAFWAQSSQTAAFKTNDLENVQVIYEDAKNNDELRDAFCKVESFSVTPTTTARTVILTRPMAQINVGTSGADYKHLLTGSLVHPNAAITRSKIKLTGVSNTINVVTDEIGKETSEAVFDWSPLAAYIGNGGKIPEDKGIATPSLEGGKDALTEYQKNLIQCDGEEFLRVDLNHDGTIDNYKTNYPTLDSKGGFLTETFKYLSMCYALVPAQISDEAQGKDADDEDGEGEGGGDDTGNGNGADNGDDKDYEIKDPYTSSVLSKVEVFFAEGKAGDKVDSKRDNPTMTLENVPVHRNWRTNIIGGLAYIKDPDDPDDPNIPEGPDPSSVFNYKNTRVYLDNMFYDEYNGYRDDYNKEEDYYEFDKQPSDEDPSDAQDPEEDDGDEGKDDATE